MRDIYIFSFFYNLSVKKFRTFYISEWREQKRIRTKETPNDPALLVRHRLARGHLEAGPALRNEVRALLGKKSLHVYSG